MECGSVQKELYSNGWAFWNNRILNAKQLKNEKNVLRLNN
jgi:hypothetical protein